MKIKFFIKTIFISLILASSLQADDIIVPANALPANAKSFIQQYFPKNQVVLVKQDIDSYDVYLNNGIEVDFTSAGQWKEVDGNYQMLNTAFIPAAIMQAINSGYKGALIVKVEKEITGYKINLNNNLKLYFNQAGQLMGQKFDD